MSRPIVPRIVLLLIVAIVVAGCTSERSTGTSKQKSRERGGTPAGSEAAPKPLHVRDVSKQTGIDFVYRNGREADEKTILESLGGGVGIFDFDRDGELDLFFPGGGTISSDSSLGSDKRIGGLPSSLWRGWGQSRFTDVSTPSQVAPSRFYTHGCAIADFDGDGFGDVLVTGFGGLQLFQNQGDGTFLETAPTIGLDDGRWSSSAAWGDFNGDGHTDLYVVHYVNWSFENHPVCDSREFNVRDICGPREFEPIDDLVYYSNGDGTFRNATGDAGLVPGGKGLGAMTADLDVDGDLDIYVANDTTPNLMYLNDSRGRFVESGLISGTALDDRGVPNGSMGIAVLDFNRDLLPDLWVANYEKETFALYRNDGEAAFAHVSERSGISVLGGLFVGFGTVANDIDRDGDEDLIVANGHVMYHSAVSPVLQKAFVLRNDGGDRFLRESFPTDSYFSQEHWGRGVVTGDLDHDGDADLVFSNINEPPAVLLNDTDGSGRAFATRLVGTTSNRDGIGARLILETTAGTYFRTVCGGGSYLSQSDYAVFWTLPDGAEVRELTVTWPGGTEQRISGEVLTDRMHAGEVRLVEPAGT